jgi:uncharacterized protein YheU (UPF0270 family)
MIIPLEKLNQETLTAIIEDFILREGTDYGAIDVSNADKIAQVKEQLKRGDVVIVYSELHESINILPKAQFQEQLAQKNND